MFNISPDYFRASGTSLLAGRAFTWHDDTNAPRVAVVNREFASKILGSVPDAVGRYFKLRDGTRVRVVGLVEDGKYVNLTEGQKPAMFFPLLQSPASWTWLVVRSSRDPQQLAAAMRSVLRDIDPGMVLAIRPWSTELGGTLFPSRMATVSLGVLGMMGAMLSITGIFGMAAYSVSKRLKELGIRVALGAQRKEVLQAALGRAFKLLAIGSGVGLVLGLLATKVLAFIVYQATPRDPLVLAGVVLAMAAAGAGGHVDSGAACAVGQSPGAAARGVRKRGFASNGWILDGATTTATIHSRLCQIANALLRCVRNGGVLLRG